LRRPASSSASKQLDLQHLDLKATYDVEIRTGYDKAPAVKMTGNSLAHLQVQLADAPSSELVFYRLIQKR
jgi:hypothetical protein